MDEMLQIPNSNPSAAPEFSDDVDCCCSTPFVSAPSSPGRDIPLSGFYYSAPSSPMHFVLSTASLKSYSPSSDAGDSFFEFDLPSIGAASADELFFNGPGKFLGPPLLSTHFHRPQLLDPLIESSGDGEEDENETQTRGRDLKLRAGSLRRRTRSTSPLKNSATTSFQWRYDDEEQNSNIDQNEKVYNKIAEKLEDDNEVSNETTPCASRSSSAGRNSSSKSWVFLKEFLSRSKSEGRNHDRNKFWGSISLKDKKLPLQPLTTRRKGKEQIASTTRTGEVKKRMVHKNGAGKRTSPSPHEVHYTAKRAQAEEMRKKTFLPYRQGLLSCLSFSSKSYGAMNGFARALNPVSSS